MEDCCAVCAEPLEWLAYGPCGHNDICSTCTAKLRFILDDKCCCICKQECSTVFVTKALGDQTKSIKDFIAVPAGANDGKVGNYWFHSDTQAYFDDKQHYKMIKAMCRLSCSLCEKNSVPKDLGNELQKWNKEFKHIDRLRRHLYHVHKLKMCKLCLEGRKVFIGEQKLYTQTQLDRHLSKGNSEVDDDETERGGFMGHPICVFCKKRFYGDDEVYLHMQTEHYTCHICQRRHPGLYDYYRNYNDLEAHFSQDHFLCGNPDCLAKTFIVFSSESELKKHNAIEHAGIMSHSLRNAAPQDLYICWSDAHEQSWLTRFLDGLSGADKAMLQRAELDRVAQIPLIHPSSRVCCDILTYWDADRNTFQFPHVVGEWTITLYDVYRILGVPIHGDQLTLDEATSYQQWISWARYLGCARPGNQKGVKLDSVPFLDIPPLRKAIIGLIATRLSGDKKAHILLFNWAPIVQQVEKGRVYAWGIDILARVYRVLYHIVRWRTYSCSHPSLIMGWMLEHIIPFQQHMPNADAIAPRVIKWAGVGQFVVGTQTGASLTDADMIGDPYTDMDGLWIGDGTARAHCRGVTILTDRSGVVETHHVGRVLQQFGEVPPADLPPVVTILRSRRFSTEFPVTRGVSIQRARRRVPPQPRAPPQAPPLQRQRPRPRHARLAVKEGSEDTIDEELDNSTDKDSDDTTDKNYKDYEYGRAQVTLGVSTRRTTRRVPPPPQAPPLQPPPPQHAQLLTTRDEDYKPNREAQDFIVEVTVAQQGFEEGSIAQRVEACCEYRGEERAPYQEAPLQQYPPEQDEPHVLWSAERMKAVDPTWQTGDPCAMEQQRGLFRTSVLEIPVTILGREEPLVDARMSAIAGRHTDILVPVNHVGQNIIGFQREISDLQVENRLLRNMTRIRGGPSHHTHSQSRIKVQGCSQTHGQREKTPVQSETMESRRRERSRSPRLPNP